MFDRPQRLGKANLADNSVDSAKSLGHLSMAVTVKRRNSVKVPTRLDPPAKILFGNCGTKAATKRFTSNDKQKWNSPVAGYNHRRVSLKQHQIKREGEFEMKPLKSGLAVVATLTLSACAGYDIERMRDAQPSGSAFTQALAAEYRQITLFEADEMYDWRDAGYFARKGLTTAEGEVVQPEPLENWNLPEPEVTEIDLARSKLVTLLDATARNKAPKLAAHAQGRFDCWVEQQEENHQPEHIAACRSAFLAALKDLEAAMAPPPAPAQPAIIEPKRYVILFDFDSDLLSAAGRTAINDALAATSDVIAPAFSVTGHADRVGSEGYNQELSIRRATTVRDYLIKRGVPAARVSIAGRGESTLAVVTADGVREQANRRVELIVE